MAKDKTNIEEKIIDIWNWIAGNMVSPNSDKQIRLAQKFLPEFKEKLPEWINRNYTPNDQLQAECEKYARERVLNQYFDNDKGYYTGYCDRDGVKIYTGDIVRFENTYPEGGIWEAEVVFDDGYPTVKTFEDIKQVKNPDGWDKDYDWIKSRWWSTQVGYGEYGTWNCFRTPLNELAGVFESSDEFFKAQEKFNERYGEFYSNYNLYRPLPIKVVENFKKERREHE